MPKTPKDPPATSPWPIPLSPEQVKARLKVTLETLRSDRPIPFAMRLEGPDHPHVELHDSLPGHFVNRHDQSVILDQVGNELARLHFEMVKRLTRPETSN